MFRNLSNWTDHHLPSGKIISLDIDKTDYRIDCDGVTFENPLFFDRTIKKIKESPKTIDKERSKKGRKQKGKYAKLFTRSSKKKPEKQLPPQTLPLPHWQIQRNSPQKNWISEKRHGITYTNPEGALIKKRQHLDNIFGKGPYIICRIILWVKKGMIGLKHHFQRSNSH